jgi:quinol monooxygenase YgiN
MATLFIRHSVEDFDAWKKVYDGAASMQQHDGVVAQAVYRTPGHPNDVIVTHEFASTEAAQKFLEDPQFLQAMQHAHVSSEPVVWLGEPV